MHAARPVRISPTSTRTQASGICPYVIEPAAGVDRTVLAFLMDGYTEDEAPNAKGDLEKRTVLRLDPRVAPVKVGGAPAVAQRRSVTDGP